MKDNPSRRGDVIARLDHKDYMQQVRVDEATLASREAELNLALAGSRTQEIKAAEQAVLDAQADMELKKIEYQRNQALTRETPEFLPKREMWLPPTLNVPRLLTRGPGKHMMSF
jgi:multidrug resistance efflux pump